MEMHERDEVIFVFNADGGMVARAMDAVHKIVRPETYACDLCSITHGALTQKREWTRFLKRLPNPTSTLHRDEFARAFPGHDFDWPAVLIVARAGRPETLVNRSELATINLIRDLAALIEQRLAKRR